MSEETNTALFVGGLFLLIAVACVVFAWLREEQQLKPWSATDAGLALVSLICFSGGSILLYQGLSGQQENLFLPSMVCSAIGALASLGIVFLRASPTELGLRRFPVKWVLLGLGLVLPFMLFTWGWMELVEWFAGESEEQAIVQTVRNPSGQSERVAGLVYAIVVAPLAEEIMFRGFLLGALQRAGSGRSRFLIGGGFRLLSYCGPDHTRSIKCHGVLYGMASSS